MDRRKWLFLLIFCSAFMLSMYGIMIIIIDPYFHFHKPIHGMAYVLGNERSLNDGVLRHFEYDTIIAGTSMTDNFKTSEADNLFGGSAVKVPLSGATYKEVNDQLTRAFKYNSNIKRVIRSIDYNTLLTEKDKMRYDSYPEYLYDDSKVNDIYYIFNKSMIIDLGMVLVNTLSGKSMSTFDEYDYWSDDFVYGDASVLASYQQLEDCEKRYLSEEEKQIVIDNVEQNVIKLAAENPEVEFDFFYTPYSIYYWASLGENGICRQLEAEKIATELMLECSNIHLFGFFDEADIICNTDNYRDVWHYGGWVNSFILREIANDGHILTNENYDRYWKYENDFYTNFDYAKLNW